MKTSLTTSNLEETVELGRKIGSMLRGGEVIELISDLGGGKTTFVSGLVAGFGSSDPVASPSFTISYSYTRLDKKQFHHFDFYRLQDAGIVGAELEEFLGDPDSVVAVEWGDVVHEVLPSSRIKVNIAVAGDQNRKISIEHSAEQSYILDKVETA